MTQGCLPLTGCTLAGTHASLLGFVPAPVSECKVQQQVGVQLQQQALKCLLLQAGAADAHHTAAGSEGMRALAPETRGWEGVSGSQRGCVWQRVELLLAVRAERCCARSPPERSPPERQPQLLQDGRQVEAVCQVDKVPAAAQVG